MSDGLETDSALMQRVQQGDREAFAELVNKYQQPVIHFIYRTLPDVEEAEDLAQNVFVQVWKSAARYRTEAKFTTWMFTIARNLCLNELRRRSRHPADSIESPAPGDEEGNPRQFADARVSSADESVVREELVAKVDEAVRSLPETQRTALLLFKDDDLSYEEISKVLACSLAATKSLIHRARETLKARLKPYLQSGSWEGAESNEPQTSRNFPKGTVN